MICARGCQIYERILVSGGGSSLEDVKRVRSLPSWNLNSSFLKLFAWSKDFNLILQNSSTAQVWVRLHVLSQEYWRPRIFFAIASSVGTPVCTDSASSKPMIERTFGQVARVLVDMNVTKELRYNVLVGFAFFVELEYENLPDYCIHCKKIGHYVEICKFVNKEPAHEKTEQSRHYYKAPKKIHVQVKDGRNQGKVAEDPIIVKEACKTDMHDVGKQKQKDI